MYKFNIVMLNAMKLCKIGIHDIYVIIVYLVWTMIYFENIILIDIETEMNIYIL